MLEEIWTDERTEILKKLYEQEVEVKEIASELTNTLLTKGLVITPSAVAGKIHRLKLTGRQSVEKKGLLFSPSRARY